MIICPNCGNENENDSKFCDNCGTKLFCVCTSCGKELTVKSKFCPDCGAPVGKKSASSVKKEQPVDGLFDFSSVEEGLDDQIAEQEAYDKTLNKARAFAIRGRYEEAKKVYESLIDEDPTDVNGYIGLIRIETKNFTVFEGAKIEEAIKVAKQILRADDLSAFDEDYAAYEKERKERAARIAEENRKAEEARIAEENRKAEETRIAEENRKAEEAKKKFLATALVSNGVLKRCYSTRSEIVIPDFVKAIGAEAFKACGKTLTRVVIPDSVTSIGNSAFYWCEKLEEVSLGKAITEIGFNAFCGCKSLRAIILPEGLKKIGQGAFGWCESLERIVVPESVEFIGTQPFQMATGLKEIVVSEKNKGHKSVDGVLYTNVKGGKKLVQYAAGKADKAFIVPDNVTVIAGNAFAGCKNLESLTIPESVTTLEQAAFAYCYGLKSVEIPNSITVLEWSMFQDCDNLTSVTLPESLKEIKGTWGTCKKLKSVIVSEKNEAYRSIDGNLYTKDGKTLVLYTIGKTDAEFKIPDFVTSIAPFAFAHCGNLKIVTIPKSVTEIGQGAFSECGKLTTVMFEDPCSWAGRSVYGRVEPIPSEDLSEPKKAAECLVAEWQSYTWKRI